MRKYLNSLYLINKVCLLLFFTFLLIFVQYKYGVTIKCEGPHLPKEITREILRYNQYGYESVNKLCSNMVPKIYKLESIKNSVEYCKAKGIKPGYAIIQFSTVLAEYKFELLSLQDLVVNQAKCLGSHGIYSLNLDIKYSMAENWENLTNELLKDRAVLLEKTALDNIKANKDVKSVSELVKLHKEYKLWHKGQ